MIQFHLHVYLIPTAKDRATSWLPFGWKRKILHVRARLMDMKSVALLFPPQDPSGDYVNEIGPKAYSVLFEVV